MNKKVKERGRFNYLLFNIIFMNKKVKEKII